MKRYHVIGITFLVGFLCGIFADHACASESAPVNGPMYVCNDGSKVYQDIHQGQGVLVVNDIAIANHDFNKAADEIYFNSNYMVLWDNSGKGVLTIEDGKKLQFSIDGKQMVACQSEK